MNPNELVVKEHESQAVFQHFGLLGKGVGLWAVRGRQRITAGCHGPDGGHAISQHFTQRRWRWLRASGSHAGHPRPHLARATDVQFAFAGERPPLRLLSSILGKLRRQGHRHLGRNRRSPSLECCSDRLAQHRPVKRKLPGQTPVGCEIENQLPDSYTFPDDPPMDEDEKS